MLALIVGATHWLMSALMLLPIVPGWVTTLPPEPPPPPIDWASTPWARMPRDCTLPLLATETEPPPPPLPPEPPMLRVAA